MKYLVTGVAGFIGFHVAKNLCLAGHSVVGVDNVNDYYDVNLKEARLNILAQYGKFKFIRLDLTDLSGTAELFQNDQFQRVIHLAAQAGVRFSLENPMAYAESNIVGFLNVLENCRNNHIEHLIYASSSSVYGLNAKIPFSTLDSVDHPVSLYAATKKSNELMAHSYSHLFDIPTTGLRFFTVYGPWGRPDMAPFIFTKKILDGDSIDINNDGNMWRDFTYIDDIVEGIVRIADVIPMRNDSWTVETGTPSSSSAPFALYNIGYGNSINLMEFINSIEDELGIEAKKNFRSMQAGDVYQTYSDSSEIFKVTGYKPQVGVKEGVAKFVRWYREFYKK